MSTSVGTKTKKKQLPISDNVPKETKTSDQLLPLPDRDFENAILALENVCISTLDAPFSEGKDPSEGLYWQQIFINIATPVSLSLMESKGPRHFHYHYRHRPEDESILHPILENPIDMLAQVCKEALKQCQKQFVGIQNAATARRSRKLELALQDFLVSYQLFQDKNAK